MSFVFLFLKIVFCFLVYIQIVYNFLVDFIFLLFYLFSFLGGMLWFSYCQWILVFEMFSRRWFGIFKNKTKLQIHPKKNVRVFFWVKTMQNGTQNRFRVNFKLFGFFYLVILNTTGQRLIFFIENSKSYFCCCFVV